MMQPFFLPSRRSKSVAGSSPATPLNHIVSLPEPIPEEAPQDPRMPGLSPLMGPEVPRLWSGCYALAMLTLFVLWVPRAGYAAITLPKHRLFLLLTGVFLGGLILWGLARLCFRRRLPQTANDRSLPARIQSGLVTGLLLLFFLSALTSPYPQVAWFGNRRHEGFCTLALYLLIFAAMARWGRLQRVHALAAAVAGVTVSLLVIAQFWGYNPLHLYPGNYGFHDRGLLYSGEYLGTIGNSDLLSAYFTLIVTYLLGTYAVSRSKEAPLYLLAGGLCWFALLLSEVSAGPVAILAGFLLCLPLCVARGLVLRRMGDLLAVLALGALAKSIIGYAYSAGTLTIRFVWGAPAWMLLGIFILGLLGSFLLRLLPTGWRSPALGWSLVGLMAVAVTAALIYLYGYSGDSETLQGLSALLHGNPPDSLGSSRIAIWKEALALAGEKPWLGGGPDTYQLRSQLVFSRTTEAGVLLRVGVDAAHNEYLNLWVNTGLPSLMLYLTLLASVLLPALRRLDRRRLPLALPVLCYSIHALFGISQTVVTPLFFLFLGALAYAGKSPPASRPATGEDKAL